ncbi:MAG: ABC-F family ATP-binding cassette domain-containing protein [Alphaproteobacteria bacterium]|nr:ABC-F family ATP-binding cassette domain-containing protein [Alphaproteobacteria bacterium]
MLSIQDLTYRVGGRTLLDHASLSIGSGQRVGLVGPNGIGKSTLFKLIAGELVADGGEINLIKNASIGWVRQDLPEDDTPLIDIVLAADTERAALMLEAETVEDPDRMAYIYTRLDEIDAYDAPSRAASILAGLGFDSNAQLRPISDFSGGWRMRVALAATLFRQPNLLMLDEPTNHLDFEAMVWLENYLMRYKETLLIISHDRDILNKTVTHILHMEDKKLNAYTGTYDEFERRRAERLLNQAALREKQLKQKAHMQKFVDRFGATASKARQAQSRLKAIQKMDIVDAVMADRVTAFVFPEPQELRSPLMTLDHVDAGYETGKPILKKLNLRIDMDDRIALLGANGNGKSTLVKLLSGRLPPLAGDIVQSGKLKVGYFAQFQTDELDVSKTPYQIMQEAMIGVPEPRVRGALGKFGFDKDKADTLVGNCSGGEKARLLFCLMSYDAPHILLLDEPTNHLDIDAREALMQALNNYTGAVILVSHDPHLVENVADRLWLVADGTCVPYDDDLEGYRKLIVAQRKRERESAKKEARRSKNDKKSGANASEREAEKLEEAVRMLVEKKDEMENELANCSTAGDAGQLVRLNNSYNQLQKELAEAEAKLEAFIAQL